MDFVDRDMKCAHCGLDSVFSAGEKAKHNSMQLSLHELFEAVLIPSASQQMLTHELNLRLGDSKPENTSYHIC